MLNRTHHFFSIILLCAIAMSSCVDMDKLSDSAKISSFDIKEVFTPSATLGSVEVNNETQTINIALEHGKYLDQILFSADIKIDKDAEKVLNINPDSVLVFDKNQDGIINQDDAVIFYVRAKSGLPQEWQLILSPVDYSDNTDFKAVNIKSADRTDFTFADEAFIFKEAETDFYLKIIAPRVGTFPVTLDLEYIFEHPNTTAYTIDENGKATQPGHEGKLTFESLRDIQYITVEAEDGKQIRWPVYMESGEAVYAGNQASFRDEQKRRLNLGNIRMAMQDNAGNQYLGYDVDSINNIITINMRGAGEDGAINYPVSFALSYDTKAGQMVIGLNKGQTITLSGTGESHEFIVYDTLNDTKKVWKIVINSYRSSEADVKSFTLTRSAPSTIKFDRQATDINAETGIITLVVSEGIDDFPVTLRANIRVSDFAQPIGITSGEDFIINDMQSQKEFNVRAEDGTLKKWTICLRFSGVQNTEAKVESFRLLDYKGAKGLLQMETQSVIDHEQKTITLTVTNRGTDLPLTFHATISLSYKATFVGTQYSNSTAWSFRSLQDTRQIVVRSEDGLTENTYTVQIVDNSPAASSDADLISFKATGFPTGYTVTKTDVNQATHTILFTITAKGSAQLSFTPQITVSEGATTQGITSGTRYTYGTVKDTKTFSVISEDGAVSNTWTMSVRYVPQIPNGDMESWSTDSYSKSVPTGWASSNNSITTAVKKQSGSIDGSVCAYLETTSVLGNIAGGSIFLGWFKMDLSKLSDPKQMSHFGIPFDARPTGVTADLKYVSGGSGDKASVEIHMLNYTGSGSIDYHTYGSKNAQGVYVVDPSKEPGITVVGYGREEFGSTNGWVEKTVNVDWYYTEAQKPVTHIYVSYCTSYRADYIEGAVGSKMWVDNIRLNYEE